MSYFEEYNAHFQKHVHGTPIGCINREVSQLEVKLGSVPSAEYVGYLNLVGNDNNSVMVGVDCFITDKVSIRAINMCK